MDDLTNFLVLSALFLGFIIATKWWVIFVMNELKRMGRLGK